MIIYFVIHKAGNCKGNCISRNFIFTLLLTFACYHRPFFLFLFLVFKIINDSKWVMPFQVFTGRLGCDDTRGSVWDCTLSKLNIC